MGVHKNFGSAFKALYRKLNSVQRSLPNSIAREGTRFFVSNFTQEGFVDVGFNDWKIPQRKIPGTKAYKYPKFKDRGRRTRKILIKTGKLKRAVNNSVKEKTYRRIVWKIYNSEVPYAARHNEGLDGMPKREFMGKSVFLDKRFKLTILQAYKKGLK